MTTDAAPGPLIASGRAADVYAIDEQRVLRRYRTPSFVLYETAVMSWVAGHGYPAPRVYEASGLDIVMERLDGPTLLTDFANRPWTVFRHAATIARLLKQLHALPPAPWLVPKHSEARAIVHLDLHPDNVMLTARGPVVIDWTNAGLGDPDAEVADLWLVTSCAAIPAEGWKRMLMNAGRNLFVRALISHFDREAVAAKLPAALAGRRTDRNMSAEELTRMQRFVERNASEPR